MGNTRRNGMIRAKINKADEFYTLYQDIEKELSAYVKYDPEVFKDKTVLLPCDDPEMSNFTKFFVNHFERFGLKKLISTSYSKGSELNKTGQLSLFDVNDGVRVHTESTCGRGKIFIMTRQSVQNGSNRDTIRWKYLKGNGDFRSAEIRALRDESDFVITNPMFSLFREFLTWIIEADKRFLIIGNINCITYKEVFPMIKENKIWLGNGLGRWISGFIVPSEYALYGSEARINSNGERIVATNNCLWLTNIEHGRRHTPLSLMTMADNVKYSKHAIIRTHGYRKYDNCDAIDIPYTDAIPSDYMGMMGVPITFLDKYCPEQFEIIRFRKGDDHCDLRVDGKCPYFRILIRHKHHTMVSEQLQDCIHETAHRFPWLRKQGT